MSLIHCINKLSGGKNKDAIPPEIRKDLWERVAEYTKTLPKKAAEERALREVHADIKADKAYVAGEARRQIPGLNEPKKAPAVQAPAEPGNAYKRPAEEPKVEQPVEPLGANPDAIRASTVDAVTSVAHDWAGRAVGPTGHRVIADVAQVARKLVGSLESVRAIVKRVSPYLPSAEKWDAARTAKEATKGALMRKAEVISQLAAKLDTSSLARADDFIARSTREQKWGHKPEGFSREVTIDPEFKAAFAQLEPGEQALVDAIFKHNEDLANIEAALHKQLGSTGLFAQHERLTGPYAHLDRPGEFVATLKSKELMVAEAAERADGSNKNKKIVQDLKNQDKHYQYHAFDTRGQAEEFAKNHEDRYAFSKASAKSAQIEDRNSMDARALQKILSVVGADARMPEGARKAMEDSVRAMWLSSLDRNSVKQAARRRQGQGIAGYNKDITRSALEHARSQANHIANLAHAADINNAFYAMKNEIEHPVTRERVGQDDFNLLAAHHADSLKYNPTPFQDGVMAATSAMQLATSLSYHIANFSQPIMTTLPKLAADFGSGNYAEAWGHLMDGYKQMRAVTDDYGMTINLHRIKDKGLREALEAAADRQLLDVGMAEDLKHFDQFSLGYAPLDGTSRVVRQAMHKLRQVSSAVERWNRVSAATAAYNMAIDKGKSIAAAKEYVIDVLHTTQGDFTRAGAPLLLKQLPKVVGQYKKFQLMTAAQYTNAFVAMFRGATAEERAVGKRLLAFKLFHTAVASGVLGLPMMNVAQLIWGALNDGPDDLETNWKEKIGDKNTAQMLLHGIPSFAGIDMSAKLGEENVFSIAPYTKVDFTSKTGTATTLAGVAGPWMGQLGRMASGIGLIQQGDIYKGAEKLMPKGLEMAMQSFRLANKGYTMKNGDVLVKPDDIAAFDLALTAAGLPAAGIKNLTTQENTQYTITKYYTDTAKTMEREYLQAYKANDTAKMAELRAKWMELQRSKDAQRVHFKQMPDVLKHQPLATLVNTPNIARQREQKEQRQFLAP